MTEPKPEFDLFLSYNRNDRPAAVEFRKNLGPLTSVFRDDESIHAGEEWLERIQVALDGCGAFVVLVGRDAVTRWVGAETQVALGRHFGPHDEGKRLPIFPILLGETKADSPTEPPRPLTDPARLPAFLRLFQATVWKPGDDLPEGLLDQIRTRTSPTSKDLALEEGECPFVGLLAFQAKDAKKFFGRRRETLDALACFFDRRPGKPPVRWLEIDGNSGSGKSSLMNAGILPLVQQGWLWRPRAQFADWKIVGPMIPGTDPIEMLAERLVATRLTGKMGELVKELKSDDDALRYWLREHKGEAGDRAFLLAVDQFEELFTFAKEEERRRFDRLLAAALVDEECPLFLISTVRSDFVDRFDEDLPQLVKVRNEARTWTVSAIGEQGLREVIDGPAELAGLDVSEVREILIREAEDEPGALPLVENALTWLWDHRLNNRLSGALLNDQGGAAGILSHAADRALEALDAPERERALDLLFRLVRVDPEGTRHARRRIPRTEAIDVAGSQDVIDHLSGQRGRELGMDKQGPVRLITITDEGRQVTLIHETLIRRKRLDASGQAKPYWPTLWTYIEDHRGEAVARDRAQLLAIEIEDAAVKWDAAGRDEARRWPEDRLLGAWTEIRSSGLDVAAVIRPGVSRAFLGPTNSQEILDLLGLTAEADSDKGSGRYGAAWRLPLGHEQRETLAGRLAMLGDGRPGIGLRNGLPDIDWIFIDGGEVTMEIQTRSRDLVELPPRTVPAFWMARYPITADQFKAFVDDCYRDGRWHLPPGCPVELAVDVPPPDHRATRGNYPADSVSWLEPWHFAIG